MGLRRGIELGHRRGRRVPIVVDSPDRHADQQIWGWLNELPGVVFVDVVFVHFDDDCGEPTTLQDRKTCGTETF